MSIPDFITTYNQIEQHELDKVAQQLHGSPFDDLSEGDRATVQVLAAQEKKAFLDFSDAIEAELVRLDAMAHNAKRRETVRQLALAAVRPDISKSSVFKRDGVVAETTFYNSQKNWYHDPTMRDVLERVEALYVSYYGGQTSRIQAAEQEAWRNRLKRSATLDLDLHDKIAQKALDEDGLSEVQWRVSDAPQLLKSAHQVGSVAFGMATEKTETELVIADEHGSQDTLLDKLLTISKRVKDRHGSG